MRIRTLAAALLALALLVVAPSARADDAAVYEKLLKEKVGAVVSLKIVLHLKGSFFGRPLDQEANVTAAGVVVDKSGLVMLPSQVFSPSIGGGRRRGGGGGGVTTSVRSIRVVFPGDTKEYDAVLGAKDSKLGLAFVLIRTLGEKALETLDLATAAEPKVGEKLYGVARLGQGFDFAPVISEIRVTGSVTKPRTMWVVSGASNQVGRPLYNAAGAVTGIVVNQEGVGEGAGSRPFLLPLGVAQPTIANGLKKSREELDRILEEEEEAAAEAEADEAPKKDDGKKDDGKEEGGGAKDGD